MTFSAASVHDSKKAIQTVDKVRVGARRRPIGLAADKGYDSRVLRQALNARGIRTSIPERVFKHRRKLGRPPLNDRNLNGNRWVVERTHAWMDSFRKLARRYERTRSSFAAVNIFGCIILCLGRITQ